MGAVPYTRGLHEVGDGTYAYLSPPGTWGWSNCGLVVSGDRALLVDTQFDLPMTATLRAAIAAAVPQARVTTVVTTHANGDHCWGNQLFPDAEIIGSAAAAHGMADEVQPAQLAALSGPGSPDSPLGDYMRRHFGHFDFSGITVTPPARTFSGRLEVPVGDRTVELWEVGPAHTGGDVLVSVPDAGVLFAGDILFIGDHPIMWTGPVRNWIAACDRIIESGARHIVAGHGPVTDAAGVRLFRDYLVLVAEQAATAYAAGLPYWEAAATVKLPDVYAGWGRRERLVITMATAYRNLGAAPAELLEILAHTADAEAAK
ncbi:MBL fold metallo-hydrolase [Actinoplanes sp. NPDC049599]|uniref:MBL fold metallo-hydrolase n=1 Tax=Actinoplanes sp. NPDC049599 TaxID=3363903 RepID=UPI003799948F